MKLIVTLATLLIVAPMASALDVEAGKAKVQAVCAACHGANGISVADSIPNLAGQKAPYLQAQLKALRAGTRKNPLMNAMASQLGDDDIANVAAFLATLPGAQAAAAKSELLPRLVKTSVRFPDTRQSAFTRYHATNVPEARQVQYFFANDVALQAARDGRPLPDGSVLFSETHAAKLDSDKKPMTGPDGLFVAEPQVLAYGVMGRNVGWGKHIPDMLRNEDWNYAVFTDTKQLRPGVNQAECLACHKPMAKSSFTFTLQQLAAAAKNK